MLYLLFFSTLIAENPLLGQYFKVVFGIPYFLSPNCGSIFPYEREIISQMPLHRISQLFPFIHTKLFFRVVKTKEMCQDLEISLVFSLDSTDNIQRHYFKCFSLNSITEEKANRTCTFQV